MLSTKAFYLYVSWNLDNKVHSLEMLKCQTTFTGMAGIC